MNICVYGAASQAVHPAFFAAGEALGAAMARRGHRLIFGGGDTGLMGAVVRGVDSAGGESVGIAPSFFNQPGVLYPRCTELIFTETMRERKKRMEDMAGGIVMTPGGIGTLDEFFEILTLKQLGRHEKPIAILNCRGYFDNLLAMLQNAVKEGFLEEKCLNMFRVFEEPEELLDYMEGKQREAIGQRLPAGGGLQILRGEQFLPSGGRFVGKTHPFSHLPGAAGRPAYAETPAERVSGTVMTQDGQDVTAQYEKGAEETRKLARLLGAEGAVLKAKSPTCGCGEIYDGTFSHTVIPGDGVTAEVLRALGLELWTEQDLSGL